MNKPNPVRLAAAVVAGNVDGREAGMCSHINEWVANARASSESAGPKEAADHAVFEQ